MIQAARPAAPRCRVISAAQLADVAIRILHLAFENAIDALVPRSLALGTMIGIHLYQESGWWKYNRAPFHFREDLEYGLGVDKIEGHSRFMRVPEFKLNTMAEAQKAAGGNDMEALRTGFQHAVELHNAGKIDEAEAAYKAILEKQPNVAEVYQNLGQLYLAKKDYPSAETAFLKGLEIRPDSSDIATLLARTYQESGQPDKAMALLEKAAGANPQDAKAQFNRGIFLLNANKSEEAIAAFEAAIKADPNLSEAYFRLGAAMIGQGKIPDAITNLEKYLSLNPTDQQNVATAQGLLKALKK